MRKISVMVLSALLLLSLAPGAFAAEQPSETESATAYLQAQGIMVGDGNGDMRLNDGLTRAELAVLLVHMTTDQEHLMADSAYYAAQCTFADVPAWAQIYAGYCAANRIMVGYGNGLFGAYDPVTPAAACTTVLRARGFTEGWNYGTACTYAAGLGWIDNSTVCADVMTRGDMAVLIYRAMTGARAELPVPDFRGTGDGYLANGKPVSEGNVLELLHQIEADWPHGTVWGTSNTPGTRKNEVPSRAARWVMNLYRVNGYYACGGYAAMVSSLIFGDAANPARQVEDLSQIRPGDIIVLIRNDTGKIWHVSVSLESPNEMHSYHYTDGNHGGIVSWPDAQSPYSRENLDCYGEGKTYRVEAWTRYPENIPYTGQSMNAWGIPAPNTAA